MGSNYENPHFGTVCDLMRVINFVICEGTPCDSVHTKGNYNPRTNYHNLETSLYVHCWSLFGDGTKYVRN